MAKGTSSPTIPARPKPGSPPATRGASGASPRSRRPRRVRAGSVIWKATARPPHAARGTGPTTRDRARAGRPRARRRGSRARPRSACADLPPRAPGRASDRPAAGPRLDLPRELLEERRGEDERDPEAQEDARARRSPSTAAGSSGARPTPAALPGAGAKRASTRGPRKTPSTSPRTSRTHREERGQRREGPEPRVAAGGTRSPPARATPRPPRATADARAAG